MYKTQVNIFFLIEGETYFIFMVVLGHIPRLQATRQPRRPAAAARAQEPAQQRRGGVHRARLRHPGVGTAAQRQQRSGRSVPEDQTGQEEDGHARQLRTELT